MFSVHKIDFISSPIPEIAYLTYSSSFYNYTKYMLFLWNVCEREPVFIIWYVIYVNTATQPSLQLSINAIAMENWGAAR